MIIMGLIWVTGGKCMTHDDVLINLMLMISLVVVAMILIVMFAGKGNE